jgi:hypothetical protein
MLLYINSSTTLGKSDRTTLERKELWTLFGKRFMVCIYSYRGKYAETGKCSTIKHTQEKIYKVISKIQF